MDDGIAVGADEFTSADAYATVPGTLIDTRENKALSIVYHVLEGNVNAVTAKVRGFHETTGPYLDLICLDEVGTVQAGVDVAIAKNGSDTFVVKATQSYFRYYDCQVKSTVASTHSTAVRVRGLAK